jgi:hypothetical protein
MSHEDVQSLQSVDSIGLGDLEQPEDSIPEEEDCDDEACDLDPRVQVRTLTLLPNNKTFLDSFEGVMACASLK